MKVRSRSMKVRRMTILQILKRKFSPPEAVDRSRTMSNKDNTMAKKAAKYDKLMAELKGKVECPVCLTVPTTSQMMACPRGHLVCSPCRDKMTAEGQEECPVCREPMGNNKSLLAMVVIENMEHECTNTGCKEKLAYEEVTKHKEELCKFRLILCPDKDCEVLVPLSSFDEHAKSCPGCTYSNFNINPVPMLLSLRRDTFENGNKTWTTIIIHTTKETFCLDLRMKNSNFYIETMMLAEQDK